MKKINGFTNCNILTNEGLKKTSLKIENGKVASIGDFNEGLELNENYVVLPGFIDQHVHGAAGADAMDGTVEDLAKIANALASEGTVGFLATTMTQSVENITKALEAVKEYKEAGILEGAEILGKYGQDVCATRNRYGKGEVVDASDPNAVHENTLLNLDVTKAYVMLQWEAKWGLQEMIEKTVDWYKEALVSDDMWDFCVKQILDHGEHLAK